MTFKFVMVTSRPLRNTFNFHFACMNNGVGDPCFYQWIALNTSIFINLEHFEHTVQSHPYIIKKHIANLIYQITGVSK